MRLPLATLLAALLAGCSGETAPADQAAPSAATPSAVTPSAAASFPASRNTANGASSLTGQVSPLNSAVSGLSIRITDAGTVIDLPSDALFAFNSAELTQGATDQLRKSAEAIRSAPAGPLKVIGHTDSKGDDEFNMKLSEARAAAVAGWLRQQVGVSQRTIEVSGMGESAPIAPNETASGADDPAGRARNRRVEVVIPR